MNTRSPTEMATPTSDGQIRDRSVGVGKRERYEVEEFFEQRAELRHCDVRREPGLDGLADLRRPLERAAAAVAKGLDRHGRGRCLFDRRHRAAQQRVQ